MFVAVYMDSIEFFYQFAAYRVMIVSIIFNWFYLFHKESYQERLQQLYCLIPESYK